MKIGIIHPFFDVLGGAEQTTYSLLDVLKNSRHKVTLYTTTTSVTVPDQIKVSRVKRKTFPIGWGLQRILDAKKIFKKAKDEDVLFVSSGGLLLEDTKNPVIIYCHSTLNPTQKNLKSNNIVLSRIYHNYIKRHQRDQLEILDRSSVHLIANSNYTREKIKELFGKESKVIFPPINTEQNKCKDLSRIGVITVARFSPEKNLEFNLNVVGKIDTTYKVFGNAKFAAQFSYYNYLLEKIEDKKQITFFCNVDRKLIEDSLCESKVYFQSSEETFGISVIEGIRAGCIPIVPDNTANKETVPVSDLRYRQDDVRDAKERVRCALNGDFDEYLDELQINAEKFSKARFQRDIIEYLDGFEKTMNKKVE